MANRVRRTTAAIVAVGVIAAGLTVSNPAGADPSAPPTKTQTKAGAKAPAKPKTIGEVQKYLTDLARQSSQLVELYDQANEDMQAKIAESAKAKRLAASADREFAQARQQLASTVASAYEGGSFSTTGALLMSDSGESYLDQLQTLSVLSNHNATVVDTLTVAKRRAESTSARATSLALAAKDKRRELAQRRAAVEAKIHDYQLQLAQLNEEQRQAYLALANQQASQQQIDAVKASVADGTTTSKTKKTKSMKSIVANSSAKAQVNKAIGFALDQLGKPYVWGAAGPGSYDCSGLTSKAYAAAGISLPHSAAQQYNYGHHVSLDDLQPGDLVFWYQPIGHVALYLGNGLIVHAPTSGEDVKVIPLASDPGYWTATRLVD